MKCSSANGYTREIRNPFLPYSQSVRRMKTRGSWKEIQLRPSALYNPADAAVLLLLTGSLERDVRNHLSVNGAKSSVLREEVLRRWSKLRLIADDIKFLEPWIIFKIWNYMSFDDSSLKDILRSFYLSWINKTLSIVYLFVTNIICVWERQWQRCV